VVYGNTELSLAAKLWDLKSGRALATIGNPRHVTFNREGTFFATWNEEGRLTLRRSSDGQPVGKEVSLLTMHKDNPVKSVEDIVINATGNRLAVVYQDDTVWRGNEKPANSKKMQLRNLRFSGLLMQRKAASTRVSSI
jgi:hypothetical protein